MAWTRWILLLLFAAPLAAQNQFTVTTLADAGAGSLRQAMLDANATANQVVSMVAVPDEVRFQTGITGTILLVTPLPQVTEGISIIGPGRSLLVVDAPSSGRIFASGIGHYLGVSRMTLTNGFDAFEGGAILSRGFTVVSDVAFTNCNAAAPNSGAGPGTDGRGGAISHIPLIAELWVTNCLFNGCTAAGGNGTNGDGGGALGGAIYISNATARVSLTTIQNCMAMAGDSVTSGFGGNGMGGGLYSEATLDMDDVVVSTCDAMGGGTATSPEFGGSALGGGIYAATSIDALRVTISGCTVTGGTPGTGGGGGQARGAGLYNPGGTSLLQLCVIDTCAGSSPSSGSVTGSGIFAGSDITITESWIDSCVGTASGGGLYYGGAGTMQMQRSTISNCTGVGFRAQSGTSVLVINCTISGNGSGSVTGGIHNGGAVMQISFSTITGNGGTTWGGVYRTGGTLSILGCIIAGNTGAGSSADLDAVGSMTIQNSVVGIQDPASLAVNGASGNQVGTVASPVNAMLAGLTPNGGPTPTHALLTGSPAINMGGSTGVPTTDQRNAPRDQGIADAGSYEFGATPPNTGGNAGGEGDARCSTGAGGGIAWLTLLAALGLAVLRIRMPRRTA